MGYSVDKIRDNRSLSFAKRQYKASQENERIALTGIVTHLIATGHNPQYTHFAKIDENEKFADGKYHKNPDAFLYTEQEIYTLEVKVFLGHEDYPYVPFKTAQVLTMRDNPNDFPNPYGLYATKHGWALVSLKTILNSEYGIIEPYSTQTHKKKGFLVPKSKLKLRPWVAPPEFVNY